jgi:hypothetical protein
MAATDPPVRPAAPTVRLSRQPRSSTQASRVSAGCELLSSDETVERRGSPTVITPNNGRVLRTTRLSLEGLPAGDYKILVRIMDEVAGRSVEARQLFAVLDRPADRTPPR